MSKTIGVVLALKDKASPQLKGIADKIGITEKEARKLKKEIKAVSKEIGENLKSAVQTGAVAIGSMVAGASALVMKAGAVADRIDDMSNKIGISRQGFQEWDYLLGQNGAQIESLQMGFKTLVNQIDGVTKGNKKAIATFKALGISVKDSNGKLKTQEEVFNEVVYALQNVENSTKKAKYANDLLGRSGSELMPLFNSTNEALNKQKAEYKALGIEISDSAIDMGNKFGDSMEKLQSASNGVVAILGAELLPVATELLNTIIAEMPTIKEAVVPLLQGVSSAVQFLVKHLDVLIAVTSAVVTSFVAFKVIGGTIALIQTLTTVIGAVTTAQGIWNAVMLANPIGVVAVSIGALVGGIILLWKNWDKVTEAVKNALNWFKEVMKYTPIGLAWNVGEKIGDKIKNNDKHATGTEYAQGGLSLVGENGAELVNLPKGSQVKNASDTSKILGGNKINININIAGNMIGNKEFADYIASSFSMQLRTALETV